MEISAPLYCGMLSPCAFTRRHKAVLHWQIRVTNATSSQALVHSLMSNDLPNADWDGNYHSNPPGGWVKSVWNDTFLHPRIALPQTAPSLSLYLIRTYSPKYVWGTCLSGYMGICFLLPQQQAGLSRSEQEILAYFMHVSLGLAGTVF